MLPDEARFAAFFRQLQAVSNARHHPPRRTVISGKFSMKAAQFAVGCMPLLDCADEYNPMLFFFTQAAL